MDDPYAAGYDLGYGSALADVAAEADRVTGPRALRALCERLARQHREQVSP